MLTSITASGQQFPVNFGMNALREFNQKIGVEKLADLARLDTLTISEMTELTYIAVKHGCRLERQAFDFSFEDFCDKIGYPEIMAVFSAFIEAVTVSEKNGVAAMGNRKPLKKT